MSKLKARHVVDVFDNYYEHPCEESSRVHLKSKADAVIAEKDKENRKLKRALWLARTERNRALAAIVHCQGAWHDALDTKQSGKFWNKGSKLIGASTKCRAYADKFKDETPETSKCRPQESSEAK